MKQQKPSKRLRRSLTTPQSSVTPKRALVDAFESGDRSHQLDLVHVGRTLGYKLWKDDAFPLPERKAIVSGVTDDLFHLKNSVALHAPRNERLAIRERIDQTLENLEKEAWRLERQDSPRKLRRTSGNGQKQP